jgi:TRAP-type uncharacterized transport system substrate-binding protein
MSIRNRLLRILWKWVAPIAGIAAIGLAFYFYYRSPAPKSYHLRMTAGNPAGMRHRLATRLRSEIASRRLEFDLVPSHGSEEALDWVNRREIDIALVQGGLSLVGRPNVRQVAALHLEPMHLLVKKELFKDVSKSMTALKGKSVDLDEIGSGTHSLATAILEFAGIRSRDQDPSGGYVPVSMDRRELYAVDDVARLPDAVFLLSTLPAPSVTYLVSRHGYRLVPLPFAEAFALRSLAEPPAASHQESAQAHVVMGRIQATTIPAFTYGVEPAMPEQPLPTLGARLLLVAHKDVPPRAVYQLVEATYGAEFGQIVHPTLDPRLMDLPPEFPWHSGAALYQERNSPLLSGEVMDSAHKGLAIFAATASGLFVLWQWMKQSGKLARDKGFHMYISQVTQIEKQALGNEPVQPQTVADLRKLQEELGRVKLQALDELGRGELAGNELLPGFLVHVNDVRDYLARRILQQGGAP